MGWVDDPDRRAPRRNTKKFVAPRGVSSTATHVPQALVEMMAELDTHAAPTDSGPTSTPTPPP